MYPKLLDILALSYAIFAPAIVSAFVVWAVKTKKVLIGVAGVIVLLCAEGAAGIGCYRYHIGFLAWLMVGFTIIAAFLFLLPVLLPKSTEESQN